MYWTLNVRKERNTRAITGLQTLHIQLFYCYEDASAPTMPCKLIIQTLTEKFESHKEKQFTGAVAITAENLTYGSLYFHMGRLVWASTSVHPVRRWHRQLIQHCPQLIEKISKQKEITTQALRAQLCYQTVIEKVKHGEINRISMAKAVENYLCEILFDIVHEATLRELHAKPPVLLTDIQHKETSTFFLSFRARNIWQQAQDDWQAWQQAELMRCSPNLAPIIGQSQALEEHTSKSVYNSLINIIDGKQTFRDLSFRLNQPLLSLTQLTLPYIRRGVMGLVQVGDVSEPPELRQVIRNKTAPSQTAPRQTVQEKTVQEGSIQVKSKQRLNVASLSASQSHASLTHKRVTKTKKSPAAAESPLIIYIDDSPMDSKIMGDILQQAGFRYGNIQEATQALPLLIEQKPRLIFLDLVMPVANGYEICAQVRRVSRLKNIPIVIVTSNNTIIDRVRAKMVGASGFISKPIKRDKMLKTVHNLLR